MFLFVFSIVWQQHNFVFITSNPLIEFLVFCLYIFHFFLYTGLSFWSISLPLLDPMCSFWSLQWYQWVWPSFWFPQVQSIKNVMFSCATEKQSALVLLSIYLALLCLSCLASNWLVVTVCGAKSFALSLLNQIILSVLPKIILPAFYPFQACITIMLLCPSLSALIYSSTSCWICWRPMVTCLIPLSVPFRLLG